jgi:hypothetical protein
LAESAVSFYDLAFTGVGGGWSLENTATTTVQNTISLSQGTLSGTGNLHVSAGGFTGTGTLAMTGGLVRVDGTGSLGGNTAWQFNNLMLGGTGSGTITKTGSGTTTVLGLLRVAASETLQAGSSPWVLAGTGTVFSVGGTFTVQTAPFYYTGTSATTILDTTYAALTLAPSSGSPTYTIGGGTLTATDVVIGDGSATITVNANTNDPSLSITNDLTIRAAGTLVASNIGAFEVGITDVDNQGVVLFLSDLDLNNITDRNFFSRKVSQRVFLDLA